MTIDAEKLLKSFMVAPLQVSKELRNSLQASLKAVQLDAGINTGVNDKRQHIARAIKVEVEQSGLEGKCVLDTGICEYSAYQHEGTGKFGSGKGEYKIKPKNKKSLYWVSGGGKHFPKSVTHPGVKPQKFLYKAFARQKSFIVARMQAAVMRAFKITGLK
jgi:hypothetical protein